METTISTQLADVPRAAERKVQRRAGPRDDMSEVSAFTGGSPPSNTQIPPEGAAHSRSGDMYDAMTAASLAARYAAEHVMKLGGSAGMLPGELEPISGTSLHYGRCATIDCFAALSDALAYRRQVLAACRHSRQRFHQGARGVATRAVTVHRPPSSHQRAACQQRPCCGKSATTRGEAFVCTVKPAAAAAPQAVP